MDQSCRGRFKYCIDMVLCMDVSKSMMPYMCTVKELAVRLPNELDCWMRAKGKTISQFRVKILIFCNDAANKENAVQMTDFFNYLTRQDEFGHLVNTIVVDGGGDKSECGLEALAYAMASDWVRPTAEIKYRQIIALWSDSAPGKLAFSNSLARHRLQIPSTFQELTAWWGDDPNSSTAKMHYGAKRLLLFAPDEKHWNTINESWDNVIPVRSAVGQGLSEQNFREIVTLLIDVDA